MVLTPEDIVENFRTGNFRPLQNASDELQRMVSAYRDLAGTFDIMRSQVESAWTGPAAFASTERANELCTAVGSSAELLESCARAHDAQTRAFVTASSSVVPMPPDPDKPEVLEMIKVAVEQGPAAPFERAADYLAAKQAYQEAADHNNKAYDVYYWSTVDNQEIPDDYPNPVLLPSLGSTDVDVAVTPYELDPDDVRIRDDNGGGGEEPGGGGTPVGPGGPGGGIGDPGPLDVSPLTDDPPLPDPSLLDPSRSDPPPSDPLPPGPPWPPDVTTPNDAGPPDVRNPPPSTPDPHEPPPRNPPPPVVPPVGGGGPAPGGRDDKRDPADQAGGTYAARAATGSEMSPLGMPLGGVGDRSGDPSASGSQLGRGAGAGAGGPGSGPASAGALGGGRAGGQGGLGMMPPGSANRDEDKEHTRPEYLIEPDPDEIFGSDQSVSSPVIGAAWKPERYDDGDE